MEELKDKEAVMMTAEEKEAFAAFLAAQVKKQEAEFARQQREIYNEVVDDEIENSIPELINLSEQIKTVKETVHGNFKAILEMKARLFSHKKMDSQRSHTFTNSKGNKRITLGVYVTDGYRDTVEDGIDIVKEYISSLANSPETEALVDMVFRLLARDQKGTLKASRIVQLRKIAEKSGNERFLEGVKIIEESYQPAVSKQYVRAEMKDENGVWKTIPLGMTES